MCRAKLLGLPIPREPQGRDRVIGRDAKCTFASKTFTATTYGTLRFSKKSIDEKLSLRRRVSTSTIAPIAPRLSSSHMNQNLF